MTKKTSENGGFLMKAFRAVSGWAERNSVGVFVFDCGCCFSGRSVASVVNAENKGVFCVSSPRHADVLLVAGALTRKSAPVLRKIYEQIPAPKGVVAVGTCACKGGLFADSYAVVPDVSSVVPVDLYVPECPVSAQSLQCAVRSLFDGRGG